ncbi:Asp-tRNA(Asn)/Glu-tRNA(Gln) amidotransferase subunit GatA [Candidatus Saccharibacteria bacterium]|nr:Asp-tRNA(Asn)/Glu-tRNA(Gln) amidotransferase subunit GatA [Candidatus Saccharibacteria bacterium]MBR3377949.1 Asp-tRNA(Asn)/Glu-tRNA(Gln) amidotransferase subunit GatA [Candidatus Saccharibacteria bacterium]
MKIADKDTKAVDLVRAALEKAKEYEDYHAFISMNEAHALERAREIDAKIEKGEKVGRLAGVPFALKDNYLSPEGNTTAAAKMLEDFPSPITATAVAKIEAEGAIMIGRTNLDAYAHGGSTENSYFGPTSNAYDKERVAGGSSGGSAVAVALDIVPFALGSDTGGSIRQPASFNGVIGVKPTFGAVSRYGVVAMASSTDTMGCFAKTAEDANLVMSIMAGKDKKDSTTLDDYWTKELSEATPKKKKIGLISDFLGEGVDPEVVKAVKDYANKLKKAGYEIEEVNMPILKYALAIYYIVVPAEISSNLSRYDGIRYGFRSKEAKDLDEIYSKTRDEGFMPENKRRIMIGNFVLSSGFFDAYYLKAQKARTLLINAYNEAFEKYDALLCPTAPRPAFKIGENTDDPLQMYLEDVMTVPANLAGIPGINIPVGKSKDGLPIGAQLVGARQSDQMLLNIIASVEEK